jgi:arylformamidase
MARSEWKDISLPIYAGMVGGPIDPDVKIKLVRDPDKGDPVTMSQITMITHTGSHIDAPRHFFVKGTTIDVVPLETFIGPARVIEIKDTVSIKTAELERHNIQPGERILFKTKNSSWVYDTEKYVEGYVYITREAAHYLVARKVRLVGIDYITVGSWEDPEENRVIHRALLENGVSILEEINLAGVKAGRYELLALPIRFREGDAAPCRAVLRPLAVAVRARKAVTKQVSSSGLKARNRRGKV